MGNQSGWPPIMRGLMGNQSGWPPGGGVWGRSPQEEVTAATAAAAAATVSQELSPFGQAPGPSRPGTKYPVRGIPLFDIAQDLTG